MKQERRLSTRVTELFAPRPNTAHVTATHGSGDERSSLPQSRTSQLRDARRFSANTAEIGHFSWKYSPIATKVTESPPFACGGLLWRFKFEHSTQSNSIDVSLLTFGSYADQASSVKAGFTVKCRMQTSSSSKIFPPNSMTCTSLFKEQAGEGDIDLSLIVTIYERAPPNDFPLSRIRHRESAINCATLHMLFHIGCIRKAVLDLTPQECHDPQVETIRDLFYSLRFTSKELYISDLLQRLNWSEYLDPRSCMSGLQRGQILNQSLEDRVISVLQHTRVAKVIEHLFTIQQRGFDQNLSTGFEVSSVTSSTSMNLYLRADGCLPDLITAQSSMPTSGYRTGLFLLFVPPILRIYLNRPSKFVNGDMPILNYPHVIDLAQLVDPSIQSNAEHDTYELQALIAHSCITGDYHQAFIKPTIGANCLKYEADKVTVVSSDEMLEENMRNKGVYYPGREPYYASMLVYIRQRDAADIMSDGTYEDISKLLRLSMEGNNP